MATKAEDMQGTKNTTDSMTGLTLQTDRGLTTVADSVVAKLAGYACREVEGVAAMGTNFRRLMSRVRPGESLTQGVNVEVGKKEAAVDVVIIVLYGYPIPSLAQDVRENIITRIESGTGLIVKEVNIEIDDLVFEDTTDAGGRVE